MPCFPSLDALPATAEHVVLALSAEQLEPGLEQAIAHGAKAATIFGSCQLEVDSEPRLADRLTRKAREAGLALCGGSSMGFYNRSIGLRVAGFPSPPGLRRGGIVFIAQSGSAFSALAHNDRRLGFSLCISSGMEMTTTAADIIDWALSQPDTRVIGLFLEQVREPERFMAALEAASRCDIPVVVLKVGRTARSAAMALSHTGALAGSDLAFVAMCRRYDAIVVDDLDELAAALLYFDHPVRAGKGGIGSIHDSGGEREMVVDMAERIGIGFAPISEATRNAIQPHLDPGLIADNPLDAWGTARNFVDRFVGAFGTLVADPAVAVGVFFSDVREGYWYSAGLIEATRRVAAGTAKPVMIATNYSKTFNHDLAASLAADGIPVLEGTRESLLTLKRGFAWRDRKRERSAPPASPVIGRSLSAGAIDFMTGGQLSEIEGLSLLRDFGVPVVGAHAAASEAEAVAAAAAIGFPVVSRRPLGTHTSRMSVASISDWSMPRRSPAAYGDLARRLGKEVVVAAMAPQGVEVGVGAIIDPSFGPVVVISAGGTLIEILDDKVAALAPISADEAREMLDELRIARLLAGARGRAPSDLAALAETISRFSVLIASLADVLCEVDVNPVIASPAGVFAVDALVIANKGGS